MTPRVRRNPAARFVRLLIAASCAGAVAAAVAGCYAVQPPPAKVNRPDVFTVAIGNRQVEDGGDLEMGLSADPDKLDPTTSTSLYTRYVMSSICQKLYDINQDSDLVPQLATALPRFTDGGRTVTFGVRTGIRFADGTPFDAAAVKTTLERDLTKADSARTSDLGPITSIDTPDDRTVVLHYTKPFAPITAGLADRAGMIMSPTALKQLGNNFAQHPVCVGPFKFAKRIPATMIQVVRDPDYYDAKDVHLDSITYRIMTDSTIRAANLRSGAVQVIDTVSPQDIDSLQRTGGVGILSSPSLGYQSVTFNIGNQNGSTKPPKQIDSPVAKDVRVRRAFAMSIDRNALVNSAFDNWYEPACSPIAPSTQYANADNQACGPYDPAESRKMLQQAGYTLPLRVSMTVTNTPDAQRYAEALQASVAAGGFALQLVPTEYTTVLTDETAGKFDTLLLGWSGRIDPHGNTFSFLHSQKSNNAGGYDNPTVDSLLTEASQTTDTATRAALYGKVMEHIRSDVPIVYLYRVRNLTAYSNDVAGISVYPDGVVRLDHAAFLKGA